MRYLVKNSGNTAAPLTRFGFHDNTVATDGLPGGMFANTLEAVAISDRSDEKFDEIQFWMDNFSFFILGGCCGPKTEEIQFWVVLPKRNR